MGADRHVLCCATRADRQATRALSKSDRSRKKRRLQQKVSSGAVGSSTGIVLVSSHALPDSSALQPSLACADFAPTPMLTDLLLERSGT